jgi:hypothetical protein
MITGGTQFKKASSRRLIQARPQDFHVNQKESSMKRFPLLFAVTASALMAAALPGCASSNSDQRAMHMQMHGAGGQMEMKDMQSMCEMHKKMMASKTPAEREAMMGSRTMSPDMKTHMQMMQEKCK